MDSQNEGTTHPSTGALSDDVDGTLPAVSHYIFETYASHPSPEPLESHTGYLTRIAALNGMTTLSEVRATLLSPVGTRSQVTPTDFSVASWSMMSTALAVSQDRLLATTLYHAGHKFGRVESDNSLSALFSDSISSSLRYCPACHAEHGI